MLTPVEAISYMQQRPDCRKCAAFPSESWRGLGVSGAHVQEEIFVVGCPYAIVHHRTVVVHLQHTPAQTATHKVNRNT